MNKIIIILISVIFLTGCSDSKDETYEELLVENEVTPNIQIGDYVEAPDIFVEKDYSEIENMKVDIDMTLLSNTMAFSLLNQIMYNSNVYTDSSMKIKGLYLNQYLIDYDEYIHYIILPDDSYCCQGYIEIKLPSGVDWPEIGEEIMIIGDFIVVLQEEGFTPLYIQVSHMI